MPQCDEKQPTFEEMVAQVEAIVSAVEEGKIGLQEMIDQYEKGTQLLQRCRDMLADAEAKVLQLQLTDDNRLARTPMEMPKEEKNNSK
ncbi:MAG TPA: exodeoxyribonuclease VII small subunit [Phycisphaerae bacterium]|nr:exodeoxyribonuclease VII small subunit [Phycisphaerae bacterium]HOJ76182.1 exodeoxyribonuclease VII small subunit [Phycisphaerae bacterium]HOM53528.1 exodeoxyribonuclease VII small subunit [Phycisphaerae bacterium]HON65224.1 exodeoxyribonuclease VII small subunit [Phycisphaerae bacterium]HOQ86629.1 exodeoxyribonuclease VII small subunit [Phycisphaerae bacterium]